MVRAALSKSVRCEFESRPRRSMIMMNDKCDWQFGRCPVCDAIVSLDPERNVLCDACHVGRGQQAVIMPTKEDIDNGFNPFTVEKE